MEPWCATFLWSLSGEQGWKVCTSGELWRVREPRSCRELIVNFSRGTIYFFWSWLNFNATTLGFYLDYLLPLDPAIFEINNFIICHNGCTLSAKFATYERKEEKKKESFRVIPTSCRVVPTFAYLFRKHIAINISLGTRHGTVCLTTDWNECNNPRGPNYFIIYTFVIEIVIFPLAERRATIIYVFDAVINMGRPIYTEAQTCNLFI